ncbi:CDP-alcohol phosphatidyltransferase family protein [Rhodanobacter aciditrophus]|uniref:CDP-alcohol phosphatidyltransferase family protein n=1 Tax=Rhodanobacter aciditrophus TaxID=1623218 RepID=A0ABW4B3B3_9GAMM
MFDKYLMPLTHKPLRRVANLLVRYGVRADQVTLVGFVIGMMGVLAISLEAYLWALFAILLNRVLDGVDGAVARLSGTTDAGGYLDIVLDFIFYSGVVLGFALANPATNALAASFLIFSFMGTGSSFLAFAIMAEKHGITTLEYGKKSLYFLGGITEGAETIAFFVVMCLLPQYFAYLAIGFGILCLITTVTRILAAYRTVSQAEQKSP